MATTRKVLTPRMIMTCERYLKGCSLKQAMLESGYSASYCECLSNQHLFLKNRQVVEYIRNRQAEMAKAFSIDSAYIANRLKQISDEDKPDRTKSLELLQRMVLPMKEPEATTKDDLKQITINVMPAVKEKTD